MTLNPITESKKELGIKEKERKMLLSSLNYVSNEL